MHFFLIGVEEKNMGFLSCYAFLTHKIIYVVDYKGLFVALLPHQYSNINNLRIVTNNDLSHIYQGLQLDIQKYNLHQ